MGPVSIAICVIATVIVLVALVHMYARPSDCHVSDDMESAVTAFGLTICEPASAGIDVGAVKSLGTFPMNDHVEYRCDRGKCCLEIMRGKNDVIIDPQTDSSIITAIEIGRRLYVSINANYFTIYRSK